MKNSGFISILFLILAIAAIIAAGAYITLHVRDTNLRNVHQDKMYGYTFTYDKTWDIEASKNGVTLTKASSTITARVADVQILSECIGKENMPGKDAFVCKQDKGNAYYLQLKNAYTSKVVFVESNTDTKEIETLARSLTYLQ